MHSDTKSEAENVVEQARAWVRDNQDVSERAHRELCRILGNGPIHPSALGDFRKAHGIPKPIGGWLALFDDIERLSSQASRNGQPVVGLKNCLSDPAYWKRYHADLADSTEAGASVPDGKPEDAIQTDESIALWVRDNKVVSDIAHNHLRRILQDGPIHPAGLGGFRHKYGIPRLSLWLSLFDEIFQMSMQESRNGQPVVGLVARREDAEYWRKYRTVCDLSQEGDFPVAKSLEWKLLGLKGDDPGEIRAEIFRAFILSNYGQSDVDMGQACSKFVSDSRMSFREFFGGLNARDVSLKEWGSHYCLWIPTSPTEMKVVPVGIDSGNGFEPFPEDALEELADDARNKIPERIDFDRYAKRYNVSREVVLAAYVRALGIAFSICGKKNGGAVVGTKDQSSTDSLVKRFLNWLLRVFAGRHEKYLKKWEALLLSRNDQDGEFRLDDGHIIKGRLMDVDDGYYTIETMGGTELVERSKVKEIKAKTKEKAASRDKQKLAGTVGYEGIGRIKAWKSDKQIGFIDDSRQTYFFHRGMIADKQLIPQLDSGAIWQTVRFVIVAEAKKYGKYPSVRVCEVIAGTTISDYVKGKRAWQIGDFESARACFQKELDNPSGTNRLNALKCLAELISRTDMDSARAISLIEKYRSDFKSEGAQSSFDKMEVGYLQRANKYSEAEELIDKILQTRTLSAKQREYYEEAKRRAHSVIVDPTGELLFEELLLTRQCDFHGLEGEGIVRYDDFPDGEDDGKESELTRLREKFKTNWDKFCEHVPIDDRKKYRDQVFSKEQLRYQLTDFSLFKASGDEMAADYSLRSYLWRKAQCLLYEAGESSRNEAFAYLILTARLMAPSRYWHTVLPLVISYAVMGADAEELRRIVEDEEYRNSALSEVPIDEKTGEKIKEIVERFELNKILPEFDGIFEKLGLVLDAERGDYARLTEMVLKKIGESSELLSRECLMDIKSFVARIVELEEGDDKRKDLVGDILGKALAYISTQGYEGRLHIRDDLYYRLERFENSFLLSHLSISAIDIYYPIVHAVWDAVSSDFSHMTESVPDEKFVEIPNTYLRYERKPATGKFFVGREAKLDEIAKLFDEDVGGQCYILYGQRRSGKTSMLNNLEKRLGDDRFVYSKISAGLLSGNEGGGFLGSFTRALESKIIEDLSTSAIMPNVSSSEDFLGRLRFIGRYVQSTLTDERRRWVVGVDEFTYLYDYYLEDCDGRREVVRDFLRALKALLEEQIFHLILIGQESVVQMQRTFPNEFAIWRPNRLSYLDEAGVKQLVDVPIAKLQDNGDRLSRYRGEAFSDLFRLTAGQPWFTQMFCSRMVSYLNKNKISDITGSIIFAVARSLCEGDDKMLGEEFEPFVNLMDPSISETNVIELYYSIANATVNYSDWLPLDSVLPRNSKEMSLLEKRGIVIVKNGGVRLRMGLFAMWLRANPGQTRESFGGKTA